MTDTRTHFTTSAPLMAMSASITVAIIAAQGRDLKPEEARTLIEGVHRSVLNASVMPQPELATAPIPSSPPTSGPREPAVSVRKSTASPDFIISLIDGKSYKTLRRHLTTHGMTPESYREEFGLKPDYPMVAPNYSESRRAMAKKIGLGRKPGATIPPRSRDDV